MTTLLTGGNGWLPSHVLRLLAQRGEHVISFDLMDPDDYLQAFLGDLVRNVTFVAGDVSNRDELRQVAEDYQIDSIINAAAITPRLEREMEEPARIIDVNLGGTVNCLELLRTIPRITRMVSVSSGAAWGSGHGVDVLDEDSVSLATGLYGVIKHTGERFCQRYSELFDIDVVSVRPASVYGPMERVTPGYSGATELREILRIAWAGEPILINTLNGAHHDWTYSEDVAEGIVRAWETKHLPHDVYSITCGRNYSIGEMLAAFQRHWPELEYRVVPVEEANYIVTEEPDGPRRSNDRLLQDFGWVPPTSLEEGIHQYIAWVRENGPQ